MKDLTQGPVIKLLLGMTAFMLVGMGVQTLYSLVDLYWVGSLGPQAVAAVTIASNLMFVSLAVSQMLGVGTGALIAQAVGAKDHARAHFIFNQAMSIALLITVLFAALAWTAEGAYSRAFSADAETTRLVAGYLHWFVPAMALQFPMMAMSAALRGTGDLKPGTMVQVGTVVLNMVFAPILIFGWLGAPKLGVAGAGLATLIAVVVGVVGLLFYFRRPQTYLKLRAAQWSSPQAGAWGQILKIGLPSAMEFALMGGYMIFITVILRGYGATEQAAFGIGQRLLQAAMLPVLALSFASSALVGQNYGAKLGTRVRETYAATLKLGLISMLGLVVLAQLMPETLIRGFTEDAGVIAAGVRFLNIISFNLLAVSVAFACFGVLSGLGNTVPTLISTTTRFSFIVVATLLLIHYDRFEVARLWWLSVAGTVVQMLMNLAFLRRELRLKFGPAEAVAVPST